MSVDLHIPGDPAAVRALGDWMSRMSSSLVDVDLELAYVAGQSENYLRGEAGSAFQRTATSVRNRCSPAMKYLGDAAPVLHAYANRLDRGREDFDSYLTQAADRGLTVHGKVVLEPTTDLAACPTADADPELIAEWDAFMSRVTTYNDLATRVGTWWGELETWCSENFASLIACLEDLSPLDGIVGELASTDANKTVVDAALEAAETRTERDLADWRTVAQQMQDDADTFTDQLRSGNPATQAAAEAANPRAIREGMEELLDHVEQVSRIGKIIPIVGPAIEIVTIGAAIADGESGSSAIAGAAGGAAGGAVVGGAIAAAGGPFGWVVGGAVVATVAVGSAATWAWEAWVPVDARESIDEWLEDGTRLWQPPQLAG
ncbi:hypothetical protein [Microbacterium sp. H83]|uniref:hypothetical protein n=1 Tax=Microbacterium sp. H83 TaxID=1827324 RepID=UPI0007F3846B|nr:hypothetical protein [Microbacterium sp. H83]OAN39050.1 hypothetical protein A4X16_15405 [Microbacterium sp. H83]